MEHLPERQIDPPDTGEVPVVPYTVGLQLWFEVELSDRNVCPEAFTEDLDAVVRDIADIIRTHNRTRLYLCETEVTEVTQ
jgi:hypothetical protein